MFGVGGGFPQVEVVLLRGSGNNSQSSAAQIPSEPSPEGFFFFKVVFYAIMIYFLVKEWNVTPPRWQDRCLGDLRLWVSVVFKPLVFTEGAAAAATRPGTKMGLEVGT